LYPAGVEAMVVSLVQVTLESVEWNTLSPLASHTSASTYGFTASQVLQKFWKLRPFSVASVDLVKVFPPSVE
jgi:hypothetical protein